MCIGCVTVEARTCIANKSCDITIVFSSQIAINYSLQNAWILADSNIATASPESAFDINSFFSLGIYDAVIINNPPFVREQI